MAKFHKTREHDILISLLRKVREEAGLSQNEVSRRLGHQVNYMNRVELGRHSIDVVNLLQILDCMDQDPKAFFAQFVDHVSQSA